MKGVEVRVKLDNSIPTPLDPECAHCAQTFSRSGIMGLLVSVNWRMLDSLNPSELQYFWLLLHFKSSVITCPFMANVTRSEP